MCDDLMTLLSSIAHPLTRALERAERRGAFTRILTCGFVLLVSSTFSIFAHAESSGISHKPPRTLPEDEALTLQVRVGAAGGVAEAFVMARGEGDRQYTKFNLRETAGSKGVFETVLPRSFVRNNETIEYYIIAYTQALEELHWHDERSPARLTRKREKPATSTHVVDVRAPEGAIIDIDGATVGLTKYTGPLQPGSHKLSVRLEGYEPYALDIVMPPDRPLSLAPKLVPLGAKAAAPPPPEAPQTGAGVVVDAGAIVPLPPPTAGRPAGGTSEALRKSPDLSLTPLEVRQQAPFVRPPMRWQKSLGWGFVAAGAAAVLTGVALAPVVAAQDSKVMHTSQPGAVAVRQLQTANMQGYVTYALWGGGALLAIPGTAVVLAF
jgi:hypothetical protein